MAGDSFLRLRGPCVDALEPALESCAKFDEVQRKPALTVKSWMFGHQLGWYRRSSGPLKGQGFVRCHLCLFYVL